MNFETTWNHIVSRYEANRNEQEATVQEEWVLYFQEFFNYKKVFGEIDAQRNVQIGSGQRAIPDIIINTNGKDLLDVELKQYRLPFSIEMENQLKSYMDLLHISVGILICQKIYIYVYNFSQSKFKKAEIQFTKNNPDGIKLVELLQKENFSENSIETFIDSKNNFENNINKIKAELTNENIIDLIKAHLKTLYSNEEIEIALKNVSIHVANNSIEQKDPPVEKNDYPKQTGVTTGGMDFSKYRFQGATYGKGKLVLAVVQAYVKDHPSITYSRLKGIFYDGLQGSRGVIANESETRKVRDPEKRYFMRDTISLVDDRIWVCTQWGIENIGNFINRARELGYQIEKV